MGEPTLQQAAPPQSGGDVASSTYTVQQYVDFVVKSTDTYWTSWFVRGYNLREPFVFYDVIEPNDLPYQSTCTTPTGETLPPTPHDYSNAYYCPADTGPGATDKGAIVLPATTFQKMWTGDILGRGQSQAIGDFAAAYVVSHEFGHHIADEFATQLAAAGQTMPKITGKNNELLADCFSGLWINYAFNQGVLTDTDYQEALAAAVVVADKPGQITNDPHGTPEERVYAVRVGAELGANGYSAGNPGSCTSVYWQ